MRRVLACILGVFLLAGCGAPEETSGAGMPEADNSLTGPAEPDLDDGYMFTEREIYDPSLTTFTYFICNHTAETMEFGESYRILRMTDEASHEFEDLTPKENWGFTDIGYFLKPGGEMALTCTLDRYEEPPKPGRYRLLKDLTNGETMTAEFTLGDSPYTAETPYGFAPLETLPGTYGGDTAEEDCTVFTETGIKNAEAVEVFLRKVSLGASCQLRTVQDYGEGMPMVTDVVYENDCFLWRLWSGGDITERYFSYIITDGTDLCLSNGACWDSGRKYGDRGTLLVPDGASAEMIVAVESMTAFRLESNVIRYRIWSADGVWSAALTDVPTEFCVSWQKSGKGSAGSAYNLQNWDGAETAITGLAWQEDGTLCLICETASGGSSRLCFDPETERLTGMEICGLPLAGAF